MGNFEEIVLDDEVRLGPEVIDFSVKPMAGYLDIIFAPNPRSTNKARSPSFTIPASTRELIRGKRKNHCPKVKTKVSNLPNSLSPNMSPQNTRRLNVSPVPSPGQLIRRNRSVSPTTSNHRNPKHIFLPHPRRSIRQPNRDRKTVEELEKECDEDDGDEVPDDCFLDNVPISPRPKSQQSQHHLSSNSTSPERPIKKKSKPFGNGTSAQPAEQGELRSPRTGKFQKEPARKLSNVDGHSKIRAMSWSTAMFDLSYEAKQLTEALEEYEHKISETGTKCNPPEKPRIKSSFAELPPLRRTEMMIDPLPISKEKSAVLSRTRPSWLPPKDPAEERRHVKEYQKMMANSLEADRKREKVEPHDDITKYLSKFLGEHVL